MTYPTLPCIETKCILYPACLSKANIKCDDLRKYMNKHTPWMPEERKKDVLISEAFYDALNAFIDHVRKTLPVLSSSYSKIRIGL